MTDRTLFFLDAERRYRLAYDRRQWIIQRRRGKDWDGIWFIGDTKANLEHGLHRFEIELTCDARAQLARLPETFPRFRREAWLPGGKPDLFNRYEPFSISVGSESTGGEHSFSQVVSNRYAYRCREILLSEFVI